MLGILLVLGVMSSRAAVVPASIWDQDEAYLGLAVDHFDPAALHPHPPWFPLWVALGKGAAPFVSEPARGLQVMSAAAGAWTLFPLVALFSIWLRRDLAAAAAVLYLFLPGPWFLSGRAYSETPATFLLVVAAAWWMRREPGRSELAWGSLAAGLCVMLRPQFAPVILCLAGWRCLAGRRRDRVAVVGPLVGIVGPGVAGLVVAAGGFAVLRDALRSHLRFHLSGLENATVGLADLGISRALIRPELAIAWLVLSVVGFALWYRHRRAVGSPSPLLLCGIVPLVVTVFLLSDPGHARYALLLLALSCGPVVLAAATVLRRLTLPAVAAAVAVSLGVGLPQAQSYRLVDSPVVRALTWADQEVGEAGGVVVVVDRTLVSFADYGAAAGTLRWPVVNDFQIETGAVTPREIEPAIAVFDAGRGGFVQHFETDETFSCSLPWVLRLGPDRFLDVTVTTGARVVPVETRW